MTVHEYINAQPPAARARLRELREVVRAAAPLADESISYGMPTYTLGKRRVHFAAAKRHCALYGVVLDGCADELGELETSKGTVRFPLDRPVPEQLVRKLVLAKFS